MVKLNLASKQKHLSKVITYLPTIPIFPLLCSDAIAISKQQQRFSYNQLTKSIAASLTYKEQVVKNFDERPHRSGRFFTAGKI